MNKREKATALAARHEMEGISVNQIMLYATTAEVHGYWKGTFCSTGRPANLYALAAKIRQRQAAGQTMTRRRSKTVAYRLARRAEVLVPVSAQGRSGEQLMLL